jgi:predicted Zn-dependent protease with MMP-like domain
MKISYELFQKFTEEALNSLPDRTKKHMHNVAIFVEDFPSKEQLEKIKLGKHNVLFGLFEGYAQAKKINFGPVLPDKITLFRKAISDYCSDEVEIKEKISNTLKHEIAHHFGLDEKGARKAAVRMS